MKRTIFFLTALVFLLNAAPAVAQKSVVDRINHYGTFDHWSVREVKESGLIGGQTRYLYEFYGNPTDTLRRKKPVFVAPEGYYWRTNNVYANVSGVEKVNNTDYPEPRNGGYCIRIETHIEYVKVMGMFDMEVTCQGALLVGSLPEPIRDTKDPMSKPLYGIPFEGSPSALVFDYKCNVGNEVIRGTGFSKLKPMGRKDYAVAQVLLQKRWEDEDGNIHALRCGTAGKIFRQSQETWVNGYRLDIHYGDISDKPYYDPECMQLLHGTSMDFHAVNSKGKNVKVIEEGWAEEGVEPNFLIIKFITSNDLPFYGGVGNTLWLDNVKLVM